MTADPPGFVGCKAALFAPGGVLCYLRDDKPGLEWPARWDLPGGGREGDESAAECLLRELEEEFGLRLAPGRLVWRAVFPAMVDTIRPSVFFAGHLEAEEVARVRFGDEGQFWAVMPVAEFLAHPAGIPELQRRTGLAWADLGPGA
jgi:8-oxo-dGTP diphosphatase